MADLPLLGTYEAQNCDTTYRIVIKTPNLQDGRINGSYTVSNSPFGTFTADNELIGNFFWVGPGGRQTAPFSLYFSSFYRPEGWAYCICDLWTGAYEKDNTLVMQGMRSVLKAGELDLTSLGELTFSLQNCQ